MYQPFQSDPIESLFALHTKQMRFKKSSNNDIIEIY